MRQEQARFAYAFGYKTREAAERELEDSFASGDITPGERPEIKTYPTLNGGWRWEIEIDG
jgi:hypothetical protein